MNQLVSYCDAVQQSASSTRRRVFVVEVQGGHSGYVASYCGLITGALATYTPESNINLRELQGDIDLLQKVFATDRGEDHNGTLIVRNEQASAVYSTQLIADILKENANKDLKPEQQFQVMFNKVSPSANDRVMAVKFSLKAMEFIETRNGCYGKHDRKFSDEEISEHSQVVIGIHGDVVKFTCIKHLYDNEANVALRKVRQFIGPI